MDKKDIVARMRRITRDASPKVDPADVGYTSGQGSENCGACKHFEKPNACALVEGSVASSGWCRLFEGAKDQTQDADFEEGKHPRGEGGKFAEHAGRNAKAAEAHKTRAASHRSVAEQAEGATQAHHYQMAAHHEKASASHSKAAEHYTSGQALRARGHEMSGNVYLAAAKKEAASKGETVNMSPVSHPKAEAQSNEPGAVKRGGPRLTMEQHEERAKNWAKEAERASAKLGSGSPTASAAYTKQLHHEHMARQLKGAEKPAQRGLSKHPMASNNREPASKAHPSAEAHESLSKQHEATAKKLTASGNKVGSLIAGVNASFHRKAAEMMRAGHPEAETISKEAHRRTAESNKPSKPTLINPSGRKPGPQPAERSLRSPQTEGKVRAREAREAAAKTVAEAAAKIAPPQKQSEKHAGHAKEHEERAKTAPAGAAMLHRDAQAAHILAQREAQAVEGNPTANSYQHEKMHKTSASAHRESSKAHHAEAMLAHSAGNSTESTRQIDLARFHTQRQRFHEREEQQRQFGRLHEPKK